MFFRLGFACVLSLLAVGCVEDEGAANNMNMEEAAQKSLLGTWESRVDPVVITAVFTSPGGASGSGAVTTVQSTPVGGDQPTCRAEYVYTGTFQVSGSSVTLNLTTAKMRTVGCSSPDSETPADPQLAMNFAGALSGPFLLSETQLKLGNAYPTFTRK
jgi:hypothetical protein